MTRTIKIALDWTPNTNHSGMYVALAKGWYEEADLKVVIIPPSADYSKSETPARQLVEGTVDLCVAPSESVVSCWTSDKGKTLPKVVATLLQNDTSAIVTKKSSDISSPDQLAGKRYASYEGRFEMAIVNHFIKTKGGEADCIEIKPPKLDCFDSVMRGDADATWVFMGWEGVMAQNDGHELNVFELGEAGLPYGYTPVLMAHPDILELEGGKVMREFLRATERGYQFCHHNPDKAAEILLETANHPSLTSLGLEFLVKSQEFLTSGSHYLDKSEAWGRMKDGKWEDYVSWLLENKLLTFRDGTVVTRENLDPDHLFTNDFLD